MLQRRALLLTDVVDSTRLAEELGDVAIAEIWGAHDDLARGLLPEHRGQEIDKTDGFLLIFEAPDDAVAYAVAYHNALRGLSERLGIGLAARAGLHVGDVVLRHNPADQVARGAKPVEVEGVAKPTAARVMAVAGGGQTLLSQDAFEALTDRSLRSMSHGHWRMKGRAEPIELHEVGDDDAPFVPPPDGAKVYRVVARDGEWLPARDVPHTLPRERDVFVGREADLAKLASLVEDGASLITVLGPGGAGKTRVTRRFGWRWLGDFPGGVWFCDLSDARELQGIAVAIARTLEVPLGQDDPIEQLGTVLLNRGRTLLIFDNFEQISGHAEASVGAWLERAPEATFLISSRILLGLPGEQVLPLEPLDLRTEAVELFEARGRERKPGFVVDDKNRADVEAIVKTLDGLPLAIELAAARLAVLPPAKLRARLKDRFKLLAGKKGVAARQATLRAAIDWSWDLLDPWEQSALAQLSVFEGGLTLEYAEEVVDLEGWEDAPWAMDIVQALVDKSLLRSWEPEGAEGELRFGMYTSMQEYAREKLRTAGAVPAPEGESSADLADETTVRHLHCFAAFGEDDARAALRGPGALDRQREVSRELDNLVAAAQRGAALDEPEAAARAGLASADVFRVQGPLLAGVQVLEQAATAVQDDELRGRLALERGDLLRLSGQLDAAATALEEAMLSAEPSVAGRATVRLALVRAAERRGEEAGELLVSALERGRSARDGELEAEALRAQGIVIADAGDLQGGLEKLRAALAIRRRLGDRRSEAMELANLAVVLRRLGNLKEAADAAREAAAGHREAGNALGLGSTLLGLAMIEHLQGRMAEAEATYRDALEELRRVGNRREEGVTLGNWGVALQYLGRLDEAETALREAVQIATEVGASQVECVHSGHLADVLLERLQPELARPHLEHALALAERFGARAVVGALLVQRSALELVGGDAVASRATLAEATPLVEASGDPDAIARLRCQEGHLALAAGAPEVAREALAVARTAGYGEVASEGSRAVNFLERALEAADSRL